MCFQCTINKQWMIFHLVTVMNWVVCLIFHMLSCSLSEISGCNFPCAVKAHLASSGWISICCHWFFTKQYIWLSTSCQCSLSKNNECCFPCVVTSNLTFNRQWMIFICCHCCFTKQCVWFSTCCRYILSKSSGFGFLRVFTAHLINSGRCSICCHCCALSSVWGFPHVATAQFQTSVDAVFLVLSRQMY